MMKTPLNIYGIKKLFCAVGAASTTRIAIYRWLGLSSPVRTLWQGRPITVRPLESDLFVANQVFGDRQYTLPERLEAALRASCASAVETGETPVIVDAGANVGFSALWFAARFPQARIVAIEPDPTSYARLVEHCAATPTIEPLHAALWKDNAGVRLHDGGNGSWSTRTTNEGADTPSVTLEAVLTRIERARPILLKLDIEGAEREVGLASAATIAAFDVVIVEPHDWMDLSVPTVAPLMAALFEEERGMLVMGENVTIFRLTPGIVK